MEDIYQLLDKIKPRPGMYLGKGSISALAQFIGGYDYAFHSLGIDNPEMPPFHMFHEWAAHRFNWYEATAGWSHIILQECEGNEARALDVFYQVLEDFKRLIPIAITKVSIQPENRAFYEARQAETRQLFKLNSDEYTSVIADTLYLIEFSDLFGYYIYEVTNDKVIGIDRRFKTKEEVVKRVKAGFGENLYMVEIARDEVERLFKKLVMGS
ncbi:hypothetical protein [Xanthocytophaga agilis]|uniref:Uncharacterized protein n=1 Tax=Xanthocytophaga agilis TaxID=3048010 RepID=A0AAE3R417_9BACT|nr:hypothetical protein [Xanthocytophaga agilis]MDJ1501192.1 hypothetical protein [Xanthocytophaga agilis]